MMAKANSARNREFSRRVPTALLRGEHEQLIREYGIPEKHRRTVLKRASSVAKAHEEYEAALQAHIKNVFGGRIHADDLMPPVGRSATREAARYAEEYNNLQQKYARRLTKIVQGRKEDEETITGALAHVEDNLADRINSRFDKEVDEAFVDGVFGVGLKNIIYLKRIAAEHPLFKRMLKKYILRQLTSERQKRAAVRS